MDVLPAGTAEARVNPDLQPGHPKIPDSVDVNRAHPAVTSVLRFEVDSQILLQRVKDALSNLFT